jgi:hypothetical protein
MLVRCRCGKRLHVKDALAGKKIRCPGCEQVFIVEDAGDEVEEGIVAEKSGTRSPKPPRKKKAKRDQDDEDDLPDDDDSDDEESTASSAKQSRRGAKKKTVSLTRNIAGAVVLCVLLAVAVVLYVKKFAAPGSVTLEGTSSAVNVFIDDKQIDVPVAKLPGLRLTVDLQPGTHTVRVTRDGHEPFTKEVSVKSGETTLVRVFLKKIVKDNP